MKITEVQQPSTEALMEAFGADNNTGFRTEDLVEIYRAHIRDEWEEVTFEQLMAELDQDEGQENDSD